MAKHPARLVIILAPLLTLNACGGTKATGPVSWWHDLQGGVIAEDRPPPPGADLPYPHLGTIPPKPILPGNSYRDSIRNNLAQQRDDTERLAARSPLEITGPNPLPVGAPAPAAPPGEGAAQAQLPGADAQPVPPAAPPPPPAKATAAHGATTATAAAAPDAPAPGTPVTLAGDPLTEATPNLPTIPDAPPPPATFEGAPPPVAAAAPPLLPSHAAPAAGTPILFAPGSAVLDTSQTQPLKDFLEGRGKRSVLIEGHGDSHAETPESQQAALQLGVQRAHAVAKQLAQLHVPASAVRLSATAFGRDASVQFGP